MGGIEPPTSVLSGQRSTTELHAQILPYHCLYTFLNLTISLSSVTVQIHQCQIL